MYRLFNPLLVVIGSSFSLWALSVALLLMAYGLQLR
jgi:hypothetical protein